MSEYKELITIVVPVYKVEAYLDKCIDSIRRQTYQNLEIILVDDGSPDNCPQICDAYSKIDSRIRVIHKENGGLSSARNVGIDYATGQYIGFVDSDDYIEPTMYERLYKGIINYNCEIAICNHYVEKQGKLLLEMPPVDVEAVYCSKKANKLLIEDKLIKNYAWDKLYKTELFQGVRYPIGRNYEDIATTYLLFDHAERICRLQHLGYYYQIRENSISDNNSEYKWHRNCRDMIISMNERYQYFTNKKELQLVKLSIARMIPYIITYFKLSYKLKSYQGVSLFKRFLYEHLEEIKKNPYISTRDKTVARFLINSHWIVVMGVHITVFLEKLPKLEQIKRRIRRIFEDKNKFDFTLRPGKKIRVFLFETPCFDNLGDHAIAYAEKLFCERLSKEISELQVFVVSGWDTVSAVRQIAKEKRCTDVFFCHGGGNLGNLYGFGENFRRKILRTFPNHFIMVFPQTMYFTKDNIGRRELEKSKKVYNKCKNLTLLARDQMSYEHMKRAFQCNIIPMVDVVATIDTTKYSSKDRSGSILCLRSDMESALTAENKKRLRSMCEQIFSVNTITDTVAFIDIHEEDREQLLGEKWSMFGKAEVVVTDRLHGMIFAFITETPCVILGNNHHKVKETYKTLAKCEYLHYADSVEQVESLLLEIKNAPRKQRELNFKGEYDELFNYINLKLG